MLDAVFLKNKQYKLIVTIVKKGTASRIVAETKKAGAEGGTILLGKGTAKKSIYLDFLGINFDPEKEIILTLADEKFVDNILQAIIDVSKLDKPGNGISFVINVNQLSGIFHIMNNNML